MRRVHAAAATSSQPSRYGAPSSTAHTLLPTYATALATPGHGTGTAAAIRELHVGGGAGRMTATALGSPTPAARVDVPSIAEVQDETSDSDASADDGAGFSQLDAADAAEDAGRADQRSHSANHAAGVAAAMYGTVTSDPRHFTVALSAAPGAPSPAFLPRSAAILHTSSPISSQRRTLSPTPSSLSLLSIRTDAPITGGGDAGVRSALAGTALSAGPAPPASKASKPCNIVVGIRARPLSEAEVAAGDDDMWAYRPEDGVLCERREVLAAAATASILAQQKQLFVQSAAGAAGANASAAGCAATGLPASTDATSGSRASWSASPHAMSSLHTLLSSSALGAPAKEHRFNAVFPPETPTFAVYQQLAAPLVAAAVDGYNATLFAYGQTGEYNSGACTAVTP